jgi:hypothetical protein
MIDHEIHAKQLKIMLKPIGAKFHKRAFNSVYAYLFHSRQNHIVK